MDVWVDAARDDELPPSIDVAVGRDASSELRDASFVDPDIARESGATGDHRPAADRKVHPR
jgi:hypothetical protein